MSITAPNSAPVAIIGGGISGLACAARLKQRRVPFLLLEKSDHFGGVIHTQEENGFLFEFGPQGVLLTPELRELTELAGLTCDLLQANPRAPRFICKNGRLVRAPMFPPSLIASPLLDAATKWRLLTEPLRRSHPPDDDESIADFARRKFGQSLLDNLLGPFVSGIYAGDPELLSLRAAFPQIHKWESESGSIVRGMFKQRRKKERGADRRPTLHSLKHGIGSLLNALGKSLGASAHTSVGVESIQCVASAPAPQFRIHISGHYSADSLEASAVILAADPTAAARLLAPVCGKFASLLEPISFAPVAVVATGYRVAAIAHSLEGFGFLVPRKEGLRILGTVFNTSLFPGRAPEGHVLLTSFAGGATNSALCEWPDHQIVAAVHEDLARILDISEPPVIQRVWVYPRALPQYNIGHTRTIAALEETCREFPGIFLAGNYLEGPSTGACVARAFRLADSITSSF
ncbi:MAG TPA: protoporphyrinogen oxidase [Candidatus Acidoferrum sp.]|nr:protoporphyrinogen oxidase [Candidatus Acidoferrum sp.]